MKKVVWGTLTVLALLLNSVYAKETLMDIHLIGANETVIFTHTKYNN